MSKRKRDDSSIESLLTKYKGYSVVKEIENNLLGMNRFEVEEKDLVLSSLYDEKNYDLTRYKTLEDSLLTDGFLLPFVTVKDGEKYKILNGVKRFLLAKKNKLSPFPIVVANLSKEREIRYVLENIQSEQDSPYVKAYALSVLKNKGFSFEELAAYSSLSISQVKNLLRLLSLPDFLLQALKSFEISCGEARALLNLPLETQKELFERMKRENLSCRDLERLKRNYLGKEKKVTLSQNGKEVTATFESEEEASRFYQALRKKLG